MPHQLLLALFVLRGCTGGRGPFSHLHDTAACWCKTSRFAEAEPETNSKNSGSSPEAGVDSLDYTLTKYFNLSYNKSCRHRHLMLLRSRPYLILYPAPSFPTPPLPLPLGFSPAVRLVNTILNVLLSVSLRPLLHFTVSDQSLRFSSSRGENHVTTKYSLSTTWCAQTA